MPAAIPTPIRRRIWLCARAGQGATAIAQALDLSVRTVRHLLQRLHHQGAAALVVGYAHCGRPATQQLPPLVQEGLEIRADHPSWGAGLVRVFLRRRHPHEALPSERTLQRWFQRTRSPTAPPGRRPAAEAERARFPHEVWQVDAADQVRLQTGQGVCWLRFVDECSGAFLQTVVFPPGLLGARPGCPGTASVAAGFYRLGHAPERARGQRQALGVLE
jgi:hypothetical protein